MGLLKKIGLGLLVLIVLGMIFGGDSDTSKSNSQSNDNAASTESQSAGSQQSTSQSLTLVTKTPAEMIPTRSEIPTEFTKDQLQNLSLNVSGFESGISLSTSKFEGTRGIIGVDYSIYKFSTVEDATSWSTKIINEIKEKGGYTEIDISGCFSYKEDFGADGENGESICSKKNVVYIIEASAGDTYKSIDSFMEDAVSTLNKKIN